jgi:hypothetical protein
MIFLRDGGDSGLLIISKRPVLLNFPIIEGNESKMNDLAIQKKIMEPPETLDCHVDFSQIQRNLLAMTMPTNG